MRFALLVLALFAFVFAKDNFVYQSYSAQEIEKRLLDVEEKIKMLKKEVDQNSGAQGVLVQKMKILRQENMAAMDNKRLMDAFARQERSTAGKLQELSAQLSRLKQQLVQVQKMAKTPAIKTVTKIETRRIIDNESKMKINELKMQNEHLKSDILELKRLVKAAREQSPSMAMTAPKEQEMTAPRANDMQVQDLRRKVLSLEERLSMKAMPGALDYKMLLRDPKVQYALFSLVFVLVVLVLMVLSASAKAKKALKNTMRLSEIISKGGAK